MLLVNKIKFLPRNKIQTRTNIVKSAILSASEKLKRVVEFNSTKFSKDTKSTSLIPNAFGVIEINKLEIAITEYIKLSAKVNFIPRLFESK